MYSISSLSHFEFYEYIILVGTCDGKPTAVVHLLVSFSIFLVDCRVPEHVLMCESGSGSGSVM